MRLVPCVMLFVTVPFCPESPRYLLLRRKDKIEARKALVWLRGTEDVQEELTRIQAEGEIMANESQTVSVVGIFRDHFLRQVIKVCLVVILSQQLSGISPITMYTTAIFAMAGLGKLMALYGTIGVFCLQLASVFVSMMLMEHAGRRVLLLVGIIGSTFCCFGIVGFSLLKDAGYEWATYGSLGCVMVFIVAFSLGPGFIPWVLVSELFTLSSSGAAITLVSAGCHLSSIVTTFLFPILKTLIGDWTFAIFGTCLIFGAAYVYLRLIETKGKDVDQIQMELRQKLL
jgi:MFS family permease